MNWIQDELDFVPIDDRFSQAAQVWKYEDKSHHVSDEGNDGWIRIVRNGAIAVFDFHAQYGYAADWRTGGIAYVDYQVLASIELMGSPEYETALAAAQHYLRVFRAEALVHMTLRRDMPTIFLAEFCEEWRKYSNYLPDPVTILGLWKKYAPLVAEHDAISPIKVSFFSVFRDIAKWAYDKAYPSKGWIYLIPEPVKGTYKIGKAADPDDRIGTFEVKLPFDVNCEHLVRCTDRHKLESSLHRYYESKRVAGEWFALTPYDVAKIKALTYVDDISAALDMLK